MVLQVMDTSYHIESYCNRRSTPDDRALCACRGLSIVGKAAVGMTFFIIAPFIVMGVIAIPHIQPRNWLVCDLKAVQWGPFINVMFWCGFIWDAFCHPQHALCGLNKDSALATAVLK